MKNSIKMVCLFALILMAGCKDENPEVGKRNVALQTARDYEAQGVLHFVYDANNLTAPKSGFGVETFSGDRDLSVVTDFALQNKNLIFGFRDMEQQYNYMSMRYFDADSFETAARFAEDSGVEYVVNLETGAMCEVRMPWTDKFVSGDEFTSGVVTIKCMPENYYFVTVKFTDNSNLYQVGMDIGKCISKLPIMYGARVNGYLAGSLFAEWIDPVTAYNRVCALAKQLSADDRALLDGMAAGYKYLPTKLAAVMFYTANLLPDALRPKACSAFGVMPAMSATGKTMVCRTLDWPDVSVDFWPVNWVISEDRAGVVSPLQAITKFVYPDRTIYSIGMLGILSSVTSIDATNRNMVAILDSSTGDSYSASGKNSYVFDLAKTIRTRTTIDAMVQDMKTPAYTFNHLLLMADKDKVGFLENNINLKGESGSKGVRAMRYWDSPVGKSLAKWNYDYLIGAVNCFQLEGQVNNSNAVPELCNTARWAQMQNKVKEILDRPASAGKLTSENLWEIQTAHAGTLNPKKFDNLYNYNTLQMIQYIPADNVVKVYVKPFTGKPAATPTYFTLDLNK